GERAENLVKRISGGATGRLVVEGGCEAAVVLTSGTELPTAGEGKPFYRLYRKQLVRHPLGDPKNWCNCGRTDLHRSLEYRSHIGVLLTSWFGLGHREHPVGYRPVVAKVTEGRLDRDVYEHRLLVIDHSPHPPL